MAERRFKYTGQITGGVPEVGPVQPGVIITGFTNVMVDAILKRADFVEVDEDGNEIESPEKKPAPEPTDADKRDVSGDAPLPPEQPEHSITEPAVPMVNIPLDDSTPAVPAPDEEVH